jgi:site-specific recombinase XerD
VRDWKIVDSQHVRMFAARSHAGGLNPRSVQRRLSAVRGFFNYLAREGAANSNPAFDVRAPRTGRRLPGTLDVDTLNHLLDIPPDDALAVRDKAIMELFYSSGLRLAELVGLDIGQLDLADRTVRVLGKGSKTRIVPVGRKAVEAIRTWLKARGGVAAPDETALFVGRNGTRLKERAIQLRIAGLNRVRIYAACRSCSDTPTSPRRRSIPILISPTWPAPTTLPTPGRNARRNVLKVCECPNRSIRTARRSSPYGAMAPSPSAAMARSHSATP